VKPLASSPADFLNGADWAVILIYLGGIIVLGSWFGKDQRNTRDYFLGGKNIPWWGIGFSIVAAETSALTIIGVPAMAYASHGNLTFIQLIIGYVIARIILAVVIVPRFIRPINFFPMPLAKARATRRPGFSF
jgi:Na+/proline symporter